MSDAEAKWRASLSPHAQRLICQSECGLGFTPDEFAAAIEAEEAFQAERAAELAPWVEAAYRGVMP